MPVSKVTSAPSRVFDAGKLTSRVSVAGHSVRASSRGAVKKLLAGNGPINTEAAAITARIASGVRELSRRLEAVLREQVELEVDLFLDHLRKSAERVRFSIDGLDQDPDVRFALDDLGPQRAEAAKRFLAPCTAAQYIALREFLVDATAGVDYDIDQAEDAADVGDALLRGLENLHGFLVSKGLVSSAYREAQEEPVLAFLPVRKALRRRPEWPAQTVRAVNRERHFTRDEDLHRVAVS